ncbi:MAG: acyl-CoA dehydrogenase family protein [Halobacteriota archaeon]|nr:acyl-CoA dehydrogenase family protein [Halobacteriota archaeon]
MNLDFTEDQKLIRKSAKDFLSKECPPDVTRELEDSEEGYSEDMWKKMGELGWMGLVIPEEYGGMMGEFMDIIVLMEEIGRNVLPSPFFETIILGSMPILEFGTEDQKKEFLTKIATGDLKMTLALTESSGGYYAADIDTKATSEGDGYAINGTKLFVNYANAADYLVVACRTSEGKEPEDGITVFLVDKKSPGIEVNVVTTTALDKQCEVVFKDVKVPKENVLGAVDQGWNVVKWILKRAAIARCAEMVGGCQAVLEMTNKYSKERIQYGRPIGDFQVIQHYLANMWMKTETSKYLTQEVAWMVGEGLSCSKEVSAAKAWVSEAFKFVSERGVQIHGAIGVTREVDVGLYYRRAWAWDPMFGDPNYHREIVAKEIGL